MERINYSSSSNSSDSESPPTKKESKHKDSDKRSEKHRRKEHRHEKKSKHRQSSRDDNEKSKRRHRDDDGYRPRDKDRRDRRRDDDDRRRGDDDRRLSKHEKYDKHSRRSDEKKHKNRNRSRSRERSSRHRRSSSSSPEKAPPKKLLDLPKPSPSPSTSSSPQKSPMISLATAKPPEILPKIELPAYYNPAVINVNKFAEQQQKRKLLWSGKKEEPAKDAAKWGTAKFAQDTDGSKATKFMRLMGIKDAPKPEATAAAKPSDELFSNMEQQYEVARQVTHISRGVGLGFGSRPF